jgi:hypothetical protein
MALVALRWISGKPTASPQPSHLMPPTLLSKLCALVIRAVVLVGLIFLENYSLFHTLSSSDRVAFFSASGTFYS